MLEEKEVKVKIEQIRLFDVEKRIREALQRLERAFTDYKIDNVVAGIELGLGLPSGVKGSLTVTLTKKT